jgi:hypothetical protein
VPMTIAMVFTPFLPRAPVARGPWQGVSPAVVSVRCRAGGARRYLVAGAATL